MKLLFAILFFSTFSSISIAQDKILSYPNNIYIELLGSGFSFSANYEKYISEKSLIRVGLGFLPKSRESVFLLHNEMFFIPLDYGYQIRLTTNSKLDLGVGVTLKLVGKTLESSNNDLTVIFPNAIFGYRYQPKDGGFLFRLSFTPFMANYEIIPWGGISFGYNY